MKAIVVDAETVVQWYDRIKLNGETERILDGSVHHPKNGMVCANWRFVDIDDDFKISESSVSVFRHKEQAIPDTPEALQAALDSADIFVAHNAKFDIENLLESGFRIHPKMKIWCTMIGEYILARGTNVKLSLEEIAIRRKLPLKKGDLVKKYFDQEIGYDQMPLDIVKEYVDQDVLTDAHLFIAQYTEFQDRERSRRLINIVELMNDMLLFLVEIQRNGLKIDREALDKVRVLYQEEQAELLKSLNTIAANVMGDTPINLASGADISMLVYSRKVINKPLHIELFNIGTNEDGSDKFPPRMSDNQFGEAVRKTTTKVYRTTALNCPSCKGNKYYRKIKKDGSPWKNETKCPTCDAQGYILQNTNKLAGLKLVPNGPRDASVHGFRVGADDLDLLILQATEKGNLEAVEFLTKKKRLNAVNTYLNSFVGGIERWTRDDNILHPNFNQCVAKTGRLSSSDPNFQNQPKGKKFPIRKVVVSRWASEGGLILEADFSGLEFVVAGELSRDQQIISDILNEKDIHGQTSAIVTQNFDPTIDWKDKDHKPIRDENKPYTFAPLYGGTGAYELPHIKTYFQQFYKIYAGHEQWQFKQMDDVIQKGYIVTPSGREYRFPGTKRLRGKRTTNATNIVNYPVQGFATGDLVPLACVRALRRFRELGLLSLLILTVHDSICVDVYPGELDKVVEALTWAMTEMPSEVKERWNYEMLLPLRIEVSVGPNWGDLKDIHKWLTPDL